MQRSPSSANANEISGRFRQIDPKKQKHYLHAAVITGGMLIGVGVLTFLVMQFAKIHTLIDCIYTGNESNPGLVVAYAETMHGEDGDFLRGYRVEYISLKRDKVADRKFLVRSEDDIPDAPVLHHINDQTIWLVAQQGMHGSTGYMSKFGVENDKLTVSDTQQPGSVAEQAQNSGYIRLLNKYNEAYCYNLATSAPGACPPAQAEPYENRKTAFILVNQNPGAARSRVYFYETDTADPMRISIGSGDGQSLLYRLWFSHNILSEGEFQLYKSRLKKNEKIVDVYSGDYLTSASALFSDTQTAVYADKPTPDMLRIFCFNREGKTLWKLEGKKYALGSKDSAIKVRMYEKITLIFSNRWAVGINRETNQMQWSYFF